ncbi:MAG: hypothetical protein PHT02_00690 [Tissierellia bacterium]|nr:hypothetical protein [Tissierellia bacterium]
MNIIKDKKIFDMRNPNCNIVTSIDNIVNMFDKTPVVIDVAKDKTVIGFISQATRYDENCIYGEIILYGDYKIGELKNYEIQGELVDIPNRNFEVSNVNSVSYEIISI